MPSGIEFAAGTGVTKKWEVGIAGFSGYVEVSVNESYGAAISFTPQFHVAGMMHGDASYGAGVCISGVGCLSVGFGGAFDFSASALPLSVCGSVTVHIGTPWPLSDIDETVGPLCIGG
jgi:hypothetical protein